MLDPISVFSLGNELLRENTSLSFGVYQRFETVNDTIDAYQLGLQDGNSTIKDGLYHSLQGLYSLLV